MAPKQQHGRQYDVVVFGASGYTGKYTAEHIATRLPTDLKWAVAGRSHSKLEQVVAHCRSLNADRPPPAIEVCDIDDGQLDALARKTFVLITTVGPYGQLGEHAFRACAENGTHYLDVTGEVPFVARMLAKYENAAKASGAMMFPQIGIESAPPDLLTWSLAALIRSDPAFESARGAVRDVTVSMHTIKSAPSGGTLTTALNLLENFSISEVRAGQKPYALSPIPHPSPSSAPTPSLLTRVTGLVTVPTLGLLTSSIAAGTDRALVHRTWGLLETIPSRRGQAYGPHFSFREYLRPRGWYQGIGLHLGLILFSVVLVVPFLRRLVAGYVYGPGEGPDTEVAKLDKLEYRGVAHADFPADAGGNGKGRPVAFGRVWFNGSFYHLTGIFLAEAAATLFEDDVQLGGGGIFTPACLGQPYIDRLDRAGFHSETKVLSE
ncbi:Saccharopine dehydrogenase-domain-containing protein [Lasiosphaeria miniovina]|uniref:Saccharopine dehydrogenase-domain-containing protein n=1 Tax=Lasiosphaeria miniovina TaxID=1954250 RepID=A0AA40E0T4_9PEZI|nr:Saccharopine dehydrogenase-domain-containing protein [Lasiosphaeria miniovina]KAK0722795.1 Saccharopine dehydrogenase-domain-containing protein [Lasiosphaeria miniovina]